MSRSVHAWMLDRLWVQRALARVMHDPERLARFLSRYMRWGGLLRFLICLANPILLAVALAYSGAFWPAVLLPGLAWLIVWRRVLGCQHLSDESDKVIALVLDKEGGKLGVPSRAERNWSVETTDEWRLVMRLVEPAHRSQLQAVLLDATSAPSNGTSRATRL